MARVATSYLQTALQKKRVLHGVTAPVVVEIRVDVGVAPPRVDAGGPAVQLTLRVVAFAAARAVVEADERPVGRQLMRLERALRRVADYQGRAAASEERIDLVREPAGVAELEAVPTRRKVLKRGCEPLVVAVKVLRQLPEDRPQLRRADERLDALVEALEAGT